jgi:hypothetical protein
LSQWIASWEFLARQGTAQHLGEELKMGLFGLALVGVVLGAAGTEFLRVKKPDLVEKVEDAAKRFVDSVFPSKSDDEETELE